MQEGGDAMFTTTEDQPIVMPAWATCIGERRAHVTWHEPLARTKRLLTALHKRVSGATRGHSARLAANLRLLSLHAAHGLDRQSSLR